MSRKEFYLTTPLYYVNARPHIGHAYTTVAADALARFERLMGREVHFLTGTDEHGQKVERAARAAGIEPIEFTDRLSGEFRDLWKLLNIRYDQYIRTTEPRHIRAVQEVWRHLERTGQIRKDVYEGWYCTRSEEFWAAKEITPEEAKARNLEEIHEENYFFTLSKHQEWLIRHIESHPDFIYPESRRNETLGFLKNNPLLDLCISRPKGRLKWGIQCPISEDHVTYVWFDALINYITACGYPETGDAFNRRWPADIHLIGKDILRPHTVYWPIMLHALGLEPPRTVFAHGWWMVDQEKMSKSLGNVIDPVAVVAEYGVDAFRYFMLREVPFGQDGCYSDAAITLRYNVDLANDLGNLLHRTLSMMEKYFGGVIPASGAAQADHELRRTLSRLPERMREGMARLDFAGTLTVIWESVNLANKYIDSSAPWALHKQNRQEDLKVVMSSLAEALRVLIQAVSPFMPQSAEKMWLQLGCDAGILTGTSFKDMAWNYFDKETRTAKGEPVFPRREVPKPAA